MNTESIQWQSVYQSLDEKGYAVLPALLSKEVCLQFTQGYADSSLYRSIINMKRYRFGEGEYKYFSYPLPPQIQTLREKLYAPLAIIANQWNEKLSLPEKYPDHHHELIELCKLKNQVRPTPLILQYQKGGYNTLHQDLYGDVYFPFQVVFALSQQGVDYEGGEFVLVEQTPRAQSRAEVINLNQGDALVFTTNFRPVKGTRGYYRTTMKHGISKLRSGVRYALGIIFHDAL